MGHTYTQLLTHVVFSTKDRIPYLTESTKDAVFAYMAGIAREIGASDVTLDGVADHVHIFLRLPAGLAISEAVKKIKANSSKWIHKQRLLPRSFGWQIGYAAFSVSPSQAAKTIHRTSEQARNRVRRTIRLELSCAAPTGLCLRT